MATEKRLIDANALIKTIQGTASEVARTSPYEPEWFTRLAQRQYEIIGLIDEALTADAVEVVRCKDCKHWNCWRNSNEGSGDCNLDEGYQYLATQHYDFCSYGERKDNG